MDGKPLYDYARKGIPLPRPIEKRKVTVHSLELVEWKGSEHDFRWPENKFTKEEQAAVEGKVVRRVFQTLSQQVDGSLDLLLLLVHQ